MFLLFFSFRLYFHFLFYIFRPRASLLGTALVCINSFQLYSFLAPHHPIGIYTLQFCLRPLVSLYFWFSLVSSFYFHFLFYIFVPDLLCFNSYHGISLHFSFQLYSSLAPHHSYCLRTVASGGTVVRTSYKSKADRLTE